MSYNSNSNAGRLPTPSLPPLGTDTTTSRGTISSDPGARTRAALNTDFTPTTGSAAQKATDLESVLGSQPKKAGEGQPIVQPKSVDAGAGGQGAETGLQGVGRGTAYKRGSSDPAKPFGTSGFDSTASSGTGTSAGIGPEAPGVIESRPGLVESSNIDPLTETANKDDGWANATIDPTAKSASTGPAALGYARLPSAQQTFDSLPSKDDVAAGAAAAGAATYGAASAAGRYAQDTFTGTMGTGATIGPEAPGVIESRPGLVESSNIDPLTETANRDDGWANATINPETKTTSTYPTDTVTGTTGASAGIYTGGVPPSEYAAFGTTASANPYRSAPTSTTTTYTAAEPRLPAPVTTDDLAQTAQTATSYAAGLAQKAATAVVGAGKVVYGAAVEDEELKAEGRGEIRESTGI